MNPNWFPARQQAARAAEQRSSLYAYHMHSICAANTS
jgi:hypothetical protein